MKYKIRKKIEEEYGKNSRRCRNVIKNLRKGAGRIKKETMMKNEAKRKHLRRKYRDDEEELLDKIPKVTWVWKHSQYSTRRNLMRLSHGIMK